MTATNLVPIPELYVSADSAAKLKLEAADLPSWDLTQRQICDLELLMNGGFNPIKDLYKMQVYALSAWRNTHMPPGALGPTGEVIPKNILDKAPSAELRPDQTDQDSLPPYPVLDSILTGLIERDRSVADLVAEGHDRDTVNKVERLIYISEWKRYQAAPGPRVSQRAFWLDRRYPLVNRWRDES